MKLVLEWSSEECNVKAWKYLYLFSKLNIFTNNERVLLIYFYRHSKYGYKTIETKSLI